MHDEKNKNTKQKSVQFWKQVSNGLRTPLNVIKGTADIAQSEIYDIETVKEGFRKIEESSEFLLHVVNDIVDYVTIENNELEIQEKPFNLKDMINQFTTKYYNKSAYEEKYLDTQIHGVVHEKLLGDEHYVVDILECMLSNSLKYTNSKDKLYFRIFEMGIADNKVFMRFTLTGTNQSIFEHLSKTVNGKIVTDATDLSLYNSHYILTKMGGSIEVKLDEQGNSMIVIDIPFKINEQDQLPADSQLFENERILIICDHKEEAEERGSMLREMGVAYEAVSDPEEALEMIGAAEEEKNPFSACVIDWNIRNFVIQDFINEVHMIFSKKIPLIAMAYNDKKIETKALKIGFDHVMKCTWFRSTICDLLMKNAKGWWRDEDILEKKKQYCFANKHILVAEDARLNMEFIVRILENVQADVTSAMDGMEAYNIFKREPEGYFDCILMDVNMPEMDGYEATRKIRNSRREDAKTIPIFALTANAFQSDIKDTMDAGMDGHFSKPIDIERLYETLETVFAEMKQGTYRERYQNEEKKMAARDDKMDSLTGMLSLRGFEEKLAGQRFVHNSVGFLFIEVNEFEHVVEKYGEECASDLLRQVAGCLKAQFRSSDLLAYYGNACFVAVLNYCDSGIEFVERKIQEINKIITCNKKEFLNAGISVGAAYSPKGYSTQLVSLAYEALSHVKQIGNYGCYILNDDTENQSEITENVLNRTVFGEDLFFFGGESITEIDKMDDLLTLILGENQAVGIMSGTFEEKLPITSASGFALKNLGYDAETFRKQTEAKLENILFSEDIKVLHEHAGGHEMEVRKLRFQHKDGHVVWFNSAYITVESKNGVQMWVASFRPFDENVVGKLFESDYKTVSLIFHKENTILLEKGVETVYTSDLKLRKKYNYDSLIRNVLVNMHRESEKEEYLYNTSIENILFQVEKKGIYEFISYQLREDGSSIPLRYKYRYLDEAKDAILWTQECVETLAESDDITMLLNENGFNRNVKKIMNDQQNAEKEYVILYMNIKDFKSCNEMLGFVNGNVLLRKYAEFVENSKLNPVCGARSHADQFFFLIEEKNLDYEEIVSLCYRKVEINGNTINVRLHCGVYQVENKKQKVSMMCDKAVLATENITNEYAMPYYIYDASVERHYQNRVFVLNNLERAFQKDEFQVFYQPVCDTMTGEVCSAEALVRWIMPGGKIVSPGVFVPVLESKGFISRLDYLVSEKVKRFTESRALAGKRAVPVSVNLSRMDFLNDTFLKALKEQIDDIKADKSLFRYEVTESAYINVGEDGKDLLEKIRKNQSQIYIDDFGTGYSSLQNLMEVHFDVLKLDMYFIRRIGTNIISEGIIDGAISICHRLGRKVIAEGVETEEQFRFLKERGCDYIQGYYFYKPMAEEEFARLLDE